MDFNKVAEVVHSDVQVFEERVFSIEPQTDQVFFHFFLFVLQELRQNNDWFVLMGDVFAFLDFLWDKVLFGSLEGLFLSIGFDVFSGHVVDKLGGNLCKSLSCKWNVAFFIAESIEVNKVNDIAITLFASLGLEELLIRVELFNKREVLIPNADNNNRQREGGGFNNAIGSLLEVINLAIGH
jgi:hypothetical protein